jgi:hypothetical protein
MSGLPVIAAVAGSFEHGKDGPKAIVRQFFQRELDPKRRAAALAYGLQGNGVSRWLAR